MESALPSRKHMYSYWERKYWLDHYDYIIVGGGIVGLTTAFFLKDLSPNKSIIVLDRHIIPQGASTKNAGFACFGTAGEVLDDLEHMTEDEVIRLIQLRWRGLERLKVLHRPKTINYSNSGGTEVFLDEDKFNHCSEKLDYLNKVMYEAIWHKNVFSVEQQSKFKQLYKHIIFNPHEGVLNPVHLIRHLLGIVAGKRVQVLRGMGVKHVENNNGIKVTLDSGLELSSEKLIYCTNAFSKQFLNADIVPARNQVLISKPIENFNLKGTFHYDRGYVYFRQIDNRLLIGGARNVDPQVEQTENFGSNDKVINELKTFAAQKIFGKPVEFEDHWSGIIATGGSKTPILKRLDDRTYAAIRLGGMGVAIGSELAFQVALLAESGKMKY
ncbi:MAG: FAD-binding oxidoreductase [Saprospiraceae bacterium]|nr:FAD-binding oxidoreductase [Saprospiraceae bacterium]